MLNSIKELLYNNSLLTVIHDGADSCRIASATTKPDVINPDAGAEILTHFQDDWEVLHRENEANARRADVLADIVTTITARQRDANVNLAAITQLLELGDDRRSLLMKLAPSEGATATSPPADLKRDVFSKTNGLSNLASGLRTAVETLGQMQRTAAMVEMALLRLEDLVEVGEFEARKREHLLQLELYKEKKLGKLEEIRTEYTSKHTKTMLDHEFKEKMKLQERQEVFQQAFKSDLETFKTLGTIPKIEQTKNKPSALLEEIQLDGDADALEDFLKENDG